MKHNYMKTSITHVAVAVATLGPPIVAYGIYCYHTRVSAKFTELFSRYCVDGVWDVIGVLRYIDTTYFDCTVGFYTTAVRDQLRRKVLDDHAQRTIEANRADDEGDEGDDGFEEEREEVQVEGGIEVRVNRRVRRGGRRSAARTIYFRVVASLGQRPFSTSQKLVVEDHARRHLKDMNVRYQDYPRLLDLIVGMYFTPTREQVELGAMLASGEFGRERKLVDAPR